jgi:hypothetical protein
MKKSRPEFDDSHADGFFLLLGFIPQFDLLVLKTHAIIEHLLFTLLATRLRVDSEDIPILLPFRHAAQLALAGINEGSFLRVLERFSALRNLAAHSAEAAQSSRLVEQFVTATQKWAKEHKERLAYLQQLDDGGWMTLESDADGQLSGKSIRGAIAVIFFHIVAIKQHFQDVSEAG